MVLPLLGGSPQVWNTCLMYFQAMLLVGYLYAHLTSRWLSLRRQTMVHVGLLLISLIALPIALPRGWDPPASGNVIPWLLGVLTVSLGIPFFVLASTAPLVQHWFASIDAPQSASTRPNPYVLYAASNAGSFIGLLAFPFFLEPNLRLGEQGRFWSIGYVGVVAVLITLSVVTGYGLRVAGQTPRTTHPSTRTPQPAPRNRLLWIALAFVPSSLLLGLTTYLTTDVAATPLFWVVPLAIYLLTFVIVFARPDRQPNRFIVLLHALIVVGLFTIFPWKSGLGLRFTYAFHLTLFALTALTLHGRLAASRPAPEHLTEFYLWMALGGALGGAFNAIAAPLLFKSIVEYQLMVVVAVFLRPAIQWLRLPVVERSRTFPTALVPAMLLTLVLGYDAQGDRVLSTPLMWVISIGAGLVALSLHAYPLRFGVSVALLALIAKLYQPDRHVLFADRSFFGAYRVESFSRTGHTLYHGTTIHGAQFLDARRRIPLTYYHLRSPVAQTFAALNTRLAGARIGVVGLGTGSILCYSQPGQSWAYFEIDPHVLAIARNPRFFTYLRDCTVPPRIVLGDARLTLAREPPGSYSLLILDAFSSDAIPAHLLTREALALYERLLAEHGVLLIHISNRTLRLAPVVTAVAADARLYAFFGGDDIPATGPVSDREYSSDWVAIAKRPEDVGSLATSKLWRRLTPSRGADVWTDDYWNLFRVIKW